jgi:hypothetical protein
MIVIHYPTAYKALDGYVDRYNASASNSTQKLKTATVAAAKEIIRIYGASLLTKKQQGFPLPGHLPPLRTNNQQLAGLIKCSSRSVQRYILKLRGASVITGKKFRGSNADYELWINPEILLVNHELGVNSPSSLLKTSPLNPAITQVKSSFFGTKRTDRLLPYSGNIKNNNILNEGNSVHFFENDFSGNISGNTTGNTTGNTRKIALKNDPAENTGCAGPADGPTPFPEAGEQTAEDKEVLNIYVDLFWLTAKNLLYKYTFITRKQEQTAKELIKVLYLHKKDRDPQTVHDMYIQRIRLAAEYVQKDPVKRFIPLPYIYFNLNNPKGFLGTEEWYWKGKKYKAAVNRELLLERLIKRYQNNDKMPMSERQPPLKLYKACEKRLAV